MQVQKSQLISQKNVFNFINLFKLKRYSNVKQKTEINKSNTHNSVCQNRKVKIEKIKIVCETLYNINRDSKNLTVPQ
jgi:hypothetical protein